MDNLRIRDIYTDYMTRYEMTAMLRRGEPFEPELERRILKLAQRSGAAGVASGRIRRIPHGKDGLALRVEFDSSAWTGIALKRRFLRTDLLSRLRIWLPITVKKLLCEHRWDLVSDSCKRCKITHEQMVDHTFSHFPKRVYF